MKIAIIGSGNVGGILGRRWAQKGHSVIFSSRDPRSEKIAALIRRTGPTATSADARAAAENADAVLVATPWERTQEAIENCGDLGGKVLIDATNPVLPTLTGLSVGLSTSAGEMVAEWAVGAKVVKAFNTIGANIMAIRRLQEGQPRCSTAVTMPGRRSLWRTSRSSSTSTPSMRARCRRPDCWNHWPCYGSRSP